jgi:hypothetical protein
MIEAINTFEFGLTKLMTICEQSHGHHPFAGVIKDKLREVDVALAGYARYVPGVSTTKDMTTGGVGRAKWTCVAADLLLGALHHTQAELKNAGRVELQRKANSHKAPWEVMAEIMEMVPDDEEIPF